MKIGTKSVLFGAHCFLLHPWFVAAAWWKLYGFPWDPRLWVAFFVHDLGYLGKPNMDGEEGERHPEWGAKLMTRLFDHSPGYGQRWAGGEAFEWRCCFPDWNSRDDYLLGPWGQLVLFHSRFYAKRNEARFSRLCVADKLAIVLTPAWLYLPMVRATGEIDEYMKLARDVTEKYASMNTRTDAGQRQWYLDVQGYLRRWVAEHHDGRPDSWTPEARTANTDSGVWA